MNRAFASFTLPYVTVTLLLGGVSVLTRTPCTTANGIQMLVSAALTIGLTVQHFRALAKARS